MFNPNYKGNPNAKVEFGEKLFDMIRAYEDDIPRLEIAKALRNFAKMLEKLESGKSY
tara:strand:+ start:134 stop:304 length:171 start_codon:yes stop_codon:yes gene_type:complete